MHDLTTFEQRLAARLDAEVSPSARTFDAARIARTAMSHRRWKDRLLNTLAGGHVVPLRTSQKTAAFVLVSLLVLLSVALAVGALRRGGPNLAYVRPNGDVMVANSDGSNPRVVARIKPSPLRSEVRWAPGGGHLATFDDDWTLTILDPTGRVTYTRKLDDRNSRFAWSADGSSLAVLDGGWVRDQEGPQQVVDPHLLIVSADGRVEGSTDLPADFRYTIGQGGIAWSPDGRQLAMAGFDARTIQAGNGSSIWIVDRATLQVREMRAPGGQEYDVDPAWLSDGRVVFSRLNGGIWTVDVVTEAPSQVFTPQCPCSGTTLVPFVPSPDRTRLALVAPNVGLTVLDLASGNLTVLHLPDGFGGDVPIGWTSDGSGLTIRYGAITNEPFYAGDLAVVDIATGTTTVVASDVLGYDLGGD